MESRKNGDRSNRRFEKETKDESIALERCAEREKEEKLKTVCKRVGGRLSIEGRSLDRPISLLSVY